MSEVSLTCKTISDYSMTRQAVDVNDPCVRLGVIMAVMAKRMKNKIRTFGDVFAIGFRTSEKMKFPQLIKNLREAIRLYDLDGMQEDIDELQRLVIEYKMENKLLDHVDCQKGVLLSMVDY